jgi:hypothetical protein
LADPHKLGYVVRWPLYGGHFNARDYPSHQVALSDIEAVLRETLSGSLSIDPKSYDVRFLLSQKISSRRSLMVFLAVSQGLLRRSRYTRLLRKELCEGPHRHPFGEDGI